MAFKLLKRTRNSVNPAPCVTVTERGLHFNKAAQEAYDIRNGAFVEIHPDDSSTHMVGLRLFDDGTPDAYKVKKSGSVAAQTGIKRLSLMPGTYRLVQAEEFLAFDHSQNLRDAETEEDSESGPREVAINRGRGRPRKAA